MNKITINNELNLNGYNYWQPRRYDILLSKKDRLIFLFISDNSVAFNSFFKEINECVDLKLYFSNKSGNSVYLVSDSNFILLPDIPDDATPYIKNNDAIFIAKDNLGDILFVIDLAKQ